MADPRNKFTQPDDDHPFRTTLEGSHQALEHRTTKLHWDFLYICAGRGALEEQSLGTWEDICANNGAY